MSLWTLAWPRGSHAAKQCSITLNGRQIESGTLSQFGIFSFSILRLLDLAPICSSLNPFKGTTQSVKSGGVLISAALSMAVFSMR